MKNSVVPWRFTRTSAGRVPCASSASRRSDADCTSLVPTRTMTSPSCRPESAATPDGSRSVTTSAARRTRQVELGRDLRRHRLHRHPELAVRRRVGIPLAGFPRRGKLGQRRVDRAAAPVTQQRHLRDRARLHPRDRVAKGVAVVHGAAVHLQDDVTLARRRPVPPGCRSPPR